MKRIMSFIVFALVIALYEPAIGKAAAIVNVESGVPNVSEGNMSANQSHPTVIQGQTTFFLNLAIAETAGQNNSVINAGARFAAYQSIVNNKAINRAKQYIDGTERLIQEADGDNNETDLLMQSLKSMPSMPNMTVKFLDVGQGDAIYIEYPNGQTALVDAGRSDSVIASALKAENITHVDTFIATHPDADHIGGAAYVIENYGVKKVIDSGQKGTTQSYLKYRDAAKARGITLELAKIGDNLSADENVTAKVLFVDRNAIELNDGSIVIMLSYGLTDILLTGDAEIKVEKYLLKHENLNAEILKVAHHGADTSTSQAFLNAVDPDAAILQYGYNLFGLPHAQVVNELSASGSTIYATHHHGTITVNTDGKGYSIDGDAPLGTVKSGQTSNQLRIAAKDLNGEVVTIKNIGTSSVNMTGWILLSKVGHQTYTFPDGFVLNAGATVKISSGSAAVDNPPFVLKWTESYMWNNKGDAAKLYDPFRKLIHQLK